jgi:hypothetical protein
MGIGVKLHLCDGAECCRRDCNIILVLKRETAQGKELPFKTNGGIGFYAGSDSCYGNISRHVSSDNPG